jgi:hypothetical protein
MLPDALKNESLKAWATPATRDYKGHYPQHSQESEEYLTRQLLPDQAHGGTYKGKLNPRWVETLMGLPIGWTNPNTPAIIYPAQIQDTLNTQTPSTPHKTHKTP